jgi:hypothetical protein
MMRCRRALPPGNRSRVPEFEVNVRPSEVYKKMTKCQDRQMQEERSSWRDEEPMCC